MILGMKPARYAPNWPFPEYIFIPGVHPHPKKAGGHMEGEKDPVAPVIEIEYPEHNQYLRYALDLFNYGYFWESHVYFEALWNAHNRQGSVAEFLKGMIKLGAAGVKLSINQESTARAHFIRAREILESVRNIEGELFLGFDLFDLAHKITRAEKTQEKTIYLLPQWK